MSEVFPEVAQSKVHIRDERSRNSEYKLRYFELLSIALNSRRAALGFRDNVGRSGRILLLRRGIERSAELYNFNHDLCRKEGGTEEQGR